MAWVLKSERHYLNGKSVTLYHKGLSYGILHDCESKADKAKQYKTKKDALADKKELGLDKNWEAVKIA